MAKRFSVEAVFKSVDRITAPISRMQNRVGKFTRSMQRGIRRVNRSLSKLVRGFARGARSIAKFGLVAAGAVGAALVLSINRVADAADGLAKRSRRLKFPIEEFQEWQFVAKQSGIETELFDKSIEKFTKAVGEAKLGTGTLFTVLKRASPGLLRQMNNTKNASEAFDLYLNAIRKVEDQTVKTALATAAFGRTGAKFLNITEQSTAAIKALRLEQRENGVITAAQAKAAESYNDAVSSLKASLFGLLQNVILPMLPKITETVRAWRAWIVANKDMLRFKIVEFLEAIKVRIFRVIAALREFNDKYNLIELFGKTVDVGIKMIKFLGNNGSMILKLVAGVVALSIAMKVLAGILTVVNLVMAANPVGLIIIGVTALVALLAALITNVGGVRDAFIQAGNAILNFLLAPIKLLIASSKLILGSWQPVLDFFTNLIDKVTAAAKIIVGVISKIGGGVARFFGFAKEEAAPADTQAQARSIVSPQARVASSIEEKRTVSSAEVTIRDESRRAEVTSGKLASNIQLASSGAF